MGGVAIPSRHATANWWMRSSAACRASIAVTHWRFPWRAMAAMSSTRARNETSSTDPTRSPVLHRFGAALRSQARPSSAITSPSTTNSSADSE